MAAEQKLKYAKEFNQAGFGDGFHFLTGSQDCHQQAHRRRGLEVCMGRRTKQFAHAAGIMVATPDGKLSRYFYGLAYAPQDVRMALVEASERKIGEPADYFLLFCFHYDDTQGKYTLAITNIMKLAAGLTVLLLGGFIFIFMRNEKKEQSKMNWKRVPHVG